MNVQNNYMTPVYYVWHPITDKLNPLNCWYDSLTYLRTYSVALVYAQTILYLFHDSHSPFCRNMCILPQVWCHRPPIWPPVLPLNVPNLYLASSLKTLIRELALYKLLPFHSPNLISISCCLSCWSKECIQLRGSFRIFVTNFFLW
jgi:hypothetical protein